MFITYTVHISDQRFANSEESVILKKPLVCNQKTTRFLTSKKLIFIAFLII